MNLKSPSGSLSDKSDYSNDEDLTSSNQSSLISPSCSPIIRRNSLKGMNLGNRRQGSSFFTTKDKIKKIKNYKPLIECFDSEVEIILSKKIKQCLIIFDFINVNSYVKEKEVKRSILIELNSFIPENPHLLCKKLYVELFGMIAVNIFRTLPPKENPDLDFEEENPVYEVAWPHLQLVYELFLSILELPNFDIKAAGYSIDLRFIQKLTDLFNSEDPRERDCLKNLLHRIYGKYLQFRNNIRYMMNNTFVEFIYEKSGFNGISELLEIYGSIINGFALPLKPEHSMFLFTILMPLHKNSTLFLYHSPLVYCVLQFIQKDPSLTLNLVKLFLKYWPKISSQKELLYLSELEEIMEQVSDIVFEEIMNLCFKKISAAIKSPHFQISERALFFFQNEQIIYLFKRFNEKLIPVVFDSLFSTSLKHWNISINAISLSTLNIVIEINPSLCTKLSKVYKLCLISNQKESDKFELFFEQFTNLKFNKD